MRLLQAITLIIIIVAAVSSYSLCLLGVLHAPSFMASAAPKVGQALAGFAPFMIPVRTKPVSAEAATVQNAVVTASTLKPRYPTWVENAAAEIYALHIDERSEDELREIIAKHGFFELTDFDAGESDVSYQTSIQA